MPSHGADNTVAFAAASSVGRIDRQTARQTDRDYTLLCLNPENKAMFNSICNRRVK